MEYTVDSGKDAVVIKRDLPWLKENFKRTKTRFANTFDQDELLFQPNEIGPCAHPAEHADVVGMAYAATGYFGFLRGEYVLIVPFDAVMVHGELGSGRLQLEDPLREAV